MIRGGLLTLLLVLVAGGLVAANEARADYYATLVRVTCVPDANYAAIETRGIYNINVTPAMAAQGYRLLSEVAQSPVTCDLPQGQVLVEIVGYSGARLQGMCSSIEVGSMRVSLGGKEVALAEETHGGCAYFWRHDIQISKYGIEHCTFRFDDAEMLAPTGTRDISAGCKTTRLF